MSTAQALLRQVEAAGGRLVPRGGGGLKVQAPAPLPDDFLDELRQHKRELLSLLAVPATDGGGGGTEDRLGATWGAETAALIRWFRTTNPPAKPFELSPGVVIANPGLWWPSIAADIMAGPRVARGQTGALVADLRRLYDRFGQPISEGADDSDIEREAIQEIDGRLRKGFDPLDQAFSVVETVDAYDQVAPIDAVTKPPRWTLLGSVLGLGCDGLGVDANREHARSQVLPKRLDGPVWRHAAGRFVHDVVAETY